MAGDDPRKVIGARVTTRAKLITSEAECKRRYGSNWATKVVEGIVREVIRTEQKNEPPTLSWLNGSLEKAIQRLLKLILEVYNP